MATDSNSENVIAGCRRGDRCAQPELLERHYETIHRVLLSLSGNTAEAEDVVQEAFLRAFLAMPTFKQEAKVSTWLTRIALNVFYDGRRRRSALERLLVQREGKNARGEGEFPGVAQRESFEAAITRNERQGSLSVACRLSVIAIEKSSFCMTSRGTATPRLQRSSRWPRVPSLRG